MALPFAAAFACGATPDTSFELDVPSAVASKAAWYEIAVLPSACPAGSVLLGGIPLEGPVARMAFAAGSASPPGLGALPRGTYGIAAVAVANDCSIIATGCTTVSVGGGTIAVSLSATSGAPVGACVSGTSCDQATCVPGGDATSTPSCSLQLVGAGPLADPLTQGSTVLSAPAIAATPSGFLIAYREFDPNVGAARLTTLAIDHGGAALTPVQTSLPGSCTGSPEKDATALAFSGSSGTVAVSRPPCPGDAGATSGGIDLFSVDATGALGKGSFSGQPGLDVTLAEAHALAYTPSGLLLAYTNTSTRAAFAATVVGSDLAKSPAPIQLSTLDGLADETQALVIAGGDATGFLALGAASTDGGTSVGTSASFVATGADAGAASEAGAAIFPAKWASAGGVGSRIIVASNGPSADKAILWSAFDLGSATATSTGTFAPENGGAVSFVDVSLHNDHAFFAAEVDQSISLFAFTKASTFPLELTEIPFASQPAIPTGNLRDGLVAVAASDTRVAVVWGTGHALGENDDVGGYAVFACSP